MGVWMEGQSTTDGRGSLKRSSSFKKLLKLPLWGNNNTSTGKEIKILGVYYNSYISMHIHVQVSVGLTFSETN